MVPSCICTPQWTTSADAFWRGDLLRNSHSALNGRTPDEVYFGRGDDIPINLAAARQAARARRLAENRAVTCETCTATSEPTTALENAA